MADNPATKAPRGGALSALVLTLVLFLCYGAFLFGRIPVGTDHSLLYSPFFSHRWDDGPPLWQAGVLSGAPLHDNLQAALLYPPRWPFYLLPEGRWLLYYGPLYAMHYALALAGAFVLARRLSLSRIAAITAAIVFGTGGHMAGRIINPTIFFASCWLPWLLAGAVDRRPRENPLNVFGLTLLGAFMILATGSPHLMLYGALAYGVLFILQRGNAKAVSRDTHGEPPGNVFLRATVARAPAFVLAVAFAAPTLIPGILRSGRSIRQEAGADSNLADSLNWVEIPGVFLGGTGGLIHPEYIDKACYLGPVCVLLIAALLVRRESWRDRRVVAAFVLAALGLLFALGRNVGLGFVMPYIPFFRRLAGPSRALVLTALGAGLLAGLALDRLGESRRRWSFGALLLALGGIAAAAFTLLTWRSLVPGGRPPFTDDWVAPWFRSPESIHGLLFMLCDAAFLLTAAGLLFVVTRQQRTMRRGALAALIFLSLWHFMPRVAPPIDTPEFFAPPPGVRFLQERSRSSQDEPFRIAGYDALRLHNAETHSPWLMDFVEPDLAVLFGLEDIQGFDPLIERSYVRLFERTAGRAPYNDPIRNLDIDRPDPLLFDLLGVRYIIGHPLDRRLTTMPVSLDPAMTWLEVEAWQSDRATTRPLTHWLFISLVDSTWGRPTKTGEEVARLHVVAAEGRFTFPIRADIETADMLAPNRLERMAREGFQAVPHALWSFHQPAPNLDHEVRIANWRGRVAFPKPLHVRRVFWELRRKDLVLNVAGQAYRVASDPARDHWRLAFGSEDDVAPIFEYAGAKPRAFLTPHDAPEILDDGELRLSTETLRGRADVPAGKVQWAERRTNSFRLITTSPEPAWLVLRERWRPGWRAWVDDEPAPVHRVNGLLRAVEIPAGESTVRMAFRPTLAIALLAVAASLFVATLVAVALLIGRRRRRSAMRLAGQ